MEALFIIMVFSFRCHFFCHYCSQKNISAHFNLFLIFFNPEIKFATKSILWCRLTEVFPPMAIQMVGNDTIPGRTANQQAGYQAATLGVSLIIALVGGALTGELTYNWMSICLHFVLRKINTLHNSDFLKKLNNDPLAIPRNVFFSSLIITIECTFS